jgi:predicted fused transcriptional regulator/phosphomethylpyrimidine kinase
MNRWLLAWGGLLAGSLVTASACSGPVTVPSVGEIERTLTVAVGTAIPGVQTQLATVVPGAQTALPALQTQLATTIPGVQTQLATVLPAAQTQLANVAATATAAAAR